MKKGFTILELLVASLLLGMLTTILTMIFNQSSIAWRTGTAMVADLDKVRDNVAEVREEADNAFVYDGQLYRVTGLWDKNGDFYTRACCKASGSGQGATENYANYLDSNANGITANNANSIYSLGMNLLNVGVGSSARSADTYVVNVMSGGPDGNGSASDVELWNAIWSNPDVFE